MLATLMIHLTCLQTLENRSTSFPSHISPNLHMGQLRSLPLFSSSISPRPLSPTSEARRYPHKPWLDALNFYPINHALITTRRLIASRKGILPNKLWGKLPTPKSTGSAFSVRNHQTTSLPKGPASAPCIQLVEHIWIRYPLSLPPYTLHDAPR